MPEKQDTEYKSSWHDDYLEWVCCFANSPHGGRLYIGMDDDGNVVGLKNYKKDVVDIPNKIRSKIGITTEVNLLEKDGKYYIEIVVPRYATAVSIDGRYYCRSGSVKHELTGAALNEFLLERGGNTWDDMIEPDATFDDIDEATVRKFIRGAEEKGRMPDVHGLSVPEFLDKLRLTKKGKLKRAAVVLFGKDPGAFYPNTFVKIGKFEDDDYTIRFHEVVDGNIIQILDGVLAQIHHKFLVRSISFDGMERIETPEYPTAALREMLLNSLIHRKYMGTFTQIRVYDDKLFVWNAGGLPDEVTMPQLMTSHSSYPRNPTLAGACFLGGLVDAWGSGIEKIIASCKAAGLPPPEFEERGGGFMVTLHSDKPSEGRLQSMGLNARQVKAVFHLREKGKITSAEYRAMHDIAESTALRDLEGLISKNVIRKHGEGKSTHYSLSFDGNRGQMGGK